MVQLTSPQKLKHRIFTCLTKLSDRDTHSVAATELESIARSLEPTSFATFLSCIHTTDAADKSPVRKECVHLLAILSETHGNTLSPHLSKMLSAIIRRLRDPDSAVRSTCVSTTAALSSHITKPPFSSFLKPLADALFTEQDHNSQIGSALCLAAAIDAAADPEPARLMKFLPRFEKLLKCDSCKAKPAVLTLIGSVIEVGGAASSLVLRNLVPCILEFLSKEGWAVRKAAAEALAKLAVVHRDLLSEFKAGCLQVFESRKFDQVKAVREVMNHLVEEWKQVPDVSNEMSSLPAELRTCSKEGTNGGHQQPGSGNRCTASSETPQMRKKYTPANRSTPPEGSSATTVRKRSPLRSSDKKSSPAMFRKLDHKKPLDWNVEIAVSHAPSMIRVGEGSLNERDESAPERRNSDQNRFSKPETKRALFNRHSDNKMTFGGIGSGSCVVPCNEESSDINVVTCNVNDDLHKNHSECEDLSLIRKQLLQIEQQQSSLFDLLQRFMGSSQHGMQSLETRVHGIELALDEISHDFAVTRMGNTASSGSSCCSIPGADFLSSKFWRKTEGSRYSTSRYSTDGGTSSVGAMRHRAGKNDNAGTFKLDNPRLRLQGGGEFIVNPLAETRRSISRVI